MTTHCARCGYGWIPKSPDPSSCPSCGSYTWDQPVKAPIVTSAAIQQTSALTVTEAARRLKISCHAVRTHRRRVA